MMSTCDRSVLFLFIIVTFLCLINSTNCDCKLKPGAKVGGRSVPDVMSMIKGQNGFLSTIEIITMDEQSLIINEKYNKLKLYGSVEINNLDNFNVRRIYYYSGTNEKFDITDECDSTQLSVEEKYSIVNTWIAPSTAKDELDLFGNLEVLGPVSLLIYAQSVSNKAQYLGFETQDGKQAHHWLHCLNEDPNHVIEWWFDAKTNLPLRFSINSTAVYNYIIFEPEIGNKNEQISYPIGWGCYRSRQGQPQFPSFAKSDSFSLDAEAMIMYNNPDKVILSSLRAIKFQKTFSYEINEDFNTTRIIQNDMEKYVVNVGTGECKILTAKDDAYYRAIKWPYHVDVGFSLFPAIFYDGERWSNYMGQVSTDSGLMDVWEDDARGFFAPSDTSVVDCSVTYYFPAIDRSKSPDQVPTKIIIKPRNWDQIQMTDPIPYQIEIAIIDYDEKNLELADRFDISGCYDGPGEFTWFQIVMSDSSYSSYSKDMVKIRSYFDKQLTSFIPLIRLPEIVVNVFEFNYYVTVKLLERPPFKYYYSYYEHFSLRNPTSVLIRDHLEDCGEVCTNDPNCQQFSYCTDMTCKVYSSQVGQGWQESNENCTYFYKSTALSATTTLERNILASTRNILSQIKTKVVNGEFVLSALHLSAEDLFIVRGPEEIGGVENEFDDSFNPLKGDEFAVITSDTHLLNGRTIDGVSYSDCLKLCQNDDDCYTLSYCFNQHKECILSTETKANLTKALAVKTSHADGCDVFEKSYLAFYRKFPGQILVKEAIDFITDTDESQCARTCYQSTKYTCKSFSYCEIAPQTTGDSLKKACFLHQYHVTEDKQHEIDDKNTWDFSMSSCSHFAVRLSRDYTHYVGLEFDQGSVSILKEIGDIGLEQCAADCNSNEENCISFEYCESLVGDKTSNVRSTCRLSSHKNSLGAHVSSLSTNKACSVYLNWPRAIKQDSILQSKDHFGLAMGLGSFFFVVAFAMGIAGSIYYQKRRG